MIGHVLIVDDDRSMCTLLASDFERRGFDVTWQTQPATVMDTLQREALDVVLTDLRMPGVNGLDLCRQIVETRPDVPVVVVTAFGSMEMAVEALRAGAYDFVTKPFELDVLALTLERALRHRTLQQQLQRLEERLGDSGSSGILGSSELIRRLKGQVERIADTEATVLISGESGTGKELVAQALHNQSRRRLGPMITINCAALPPTLLESELFGHERGAFTDAHQARRGLFREASGGTLFLDEIGELPASLQPKLLRVLEEGRIRPVGSNHALDVDVRIITATNRDLAAEVAQGRFREDLYFRLNVIELHVPPLRARQRDIPILAQHFIDLLATREEKPVTGMTEAVAKKLLGYDWPGNVRELRNAVEHAVAWTRFDKITVSDLPDKIAQHRESQLVLGGEDPSELASLHEMEKRYILHVLEACGGHRSKAAEVLGLDRKTLYRKLRDYAHDDASSKD